VIDVPAAQGEVAQIGQPVRLDGTTKIRNLGRLPGADTEEVLAGIGLDPALHRKLVEQSA